MTEVHETIEIADAKSALEVAKAAASEIHDKLTNLRDQRSDALTEFERLSEMEQQDHLTRVLDGDDAAPIKPKRQSRITNLRERVAGIDLAIPVLQARLDRAYGAVKECEHDLQRVLLPIIATWKSHALSDCSKPFAEILDGLANLAALDAVQDSLVLPGRGVRLSEQHGIENLFSGRNLLTKFKASLPPRFADLAGEKWSNLDKLIAARAQEYSRSLGV